MHPSALIARSQPMRQVAEEVRRFAAIDANVLVSGETGVGKSVIALALHTGDPRRRRPFVTIDCRSLPTTLIEAELFGVERGAFTGATRDKPGKFEAAGAGTIYLDGVDELSLDAQGKLLRLVETKRLERVGSLASIELHARLVASTGPDPEQAVRDALFRSDLYHRLRVLPIVVPPLRERRPDILPLARLFIRDAAARFGRSTKGLTTGASAAIEAYPWPGTFANCDTSSNARRSIWRTRHVSVLTRPTSRSSSSTIKRHTSTRRLRVAQRSGKSSDATSNSHFGVCAGIRLWLRGSSASAESRYGKSGRSLGCPDSPKWTSRLRTAVAKDLRRTAGSPGRAALRGLRPAPRRADPRRRLCRLLAGRPGLQSAAVPQMRQSAAVAPCPWGRRLPGVSEAELRRRRGQSRGAV